jgi:hypothetical protein
VVEIKKLVVDHSYVADFTGWGCVGKNLVSEVR